MKGRIKNKPACERDKLALPRVGFIKIGFKSEKGYPQSVDYFIAAGLYAELFKRAYGEKPRTIQIVFPDDDPAKVCCERYEYRDDEGRLLAAGDGETFQVWNGEKYQEMTVEQYPTIMKSVEKRYPNRLFKKTGEGWQVTLTMSFIIPCVRGIAGVWQFITKGTASTIPNVREAFDAMLENRGFVKGIIFDLTVQYAKSQKPGDKSRYPVVSMVANESEDNIKKIKQAYEPIKAIETKQN